MSPVDKQSSNRTSDSGSGASDTPDPKGLDVLIADDNPDMRGYVRRCLEREPDVASVVEATNGVEALAEVRRRAFDLIVTDGAMPRLDGFELCEALQRDDHLRSVPFLLITGEYSMREVEARLGALPCAAVLAKPFNAQVLCETVRRLLRRDAAGRRPESPLSLDDEDGKQPPTT
jgi:CheY-like chemotaxis protein